MKTFSENLRYAMFRADLNQTELAEKIGCSKGTISLYLAGKTKPGDDKVEALAQALGVEPEVLTGSWNDPAEETPLPVARIGVRRAARCMCKSEQFVRDSLRDGKYPFGFAMPRKDGGWSCYINPVQFRDYVGVARFNEFFGQRA